MEERKEEQKMTTGAKLFYVCFIIVCCIIIGIVAKCLEGRREANLIYYTITGTIEKCEDRRVYLNVDTDEGELFESGDVIICYPKQGKINCQTKDNMLLVTDNGAVTKYYPGDEITSTYLKDTYRVGLSVPEIVVNTIDFKE